MKDHDQQIVHSSEDPNWRTPILCYSALNAEFKFGIDLAADERSACCPRWLGPGGHETDALAVCWTRWAMFGAMFLNPPYSRKVAAAYRAGRIKRDKVWEPHEQDVVKAGWYDIENWARKCWEESLKGCTIVGLFPFAPQTDWYRHYIRGHTEDFRGWSGHAAMEERRLPHRISYLRADGSPANNAGVNTVVVVWKPSRRMVGPWTPHSYYWSYREKEAV